MTIEAAHPIPFAMKAFLFTLLMVPGAAWAATEAKTLDQIPLAQLYPQASTGPRSPYVIVQPKYIRDTEDSLMLSAYFRLLKQLRISGLSLDSWFREDHILFFLDRLSHQEKRQLHGVFEDILIHLQAGETDLRTILIVAGPALLVSKISRIDADVEHMKDQHEDAMQFAQAKHDDEFQQTYADMPYSYHLHQVRAVLDDFGFGPGDSWLGLLLSTAAWLHDIVEDTDVTSPQLALLFGEPVAEVVTGVTKVPRTPGMTKEEQIRQTYKRTRRIQGSRILKVADRIANVEEGLIRLFLGLPTKVHKYIEEWPIFYKMLYVPGDADHMWRHLERMMTDLNYAREVALSKTRRAEELSNILGCESIFPAESP